MKAALKSGESGVLREEGRRIEEAKRTLQVNLGIFERINLDLVGNGWIMCN